MIPLNDYCSNSVDKQLSLTMRSWTSRQNWNPITNPMRANALWRFLQMFKNTVSELTVNRVTRIFLNIKKTA